MAPALPPQLMAWGQGLAGLLWPAVCPVAHVPLVGNEREISLSGLDLLPALGHARRPQANPLYQRLVDDHPSLNPLALAVAGWQYDHDGPLQNLIHRLKYAPYRHEVGTLLGQVLGHELAQAGLPLAGYSLVPIPLHPRKRRNRGYNQAEAIAQGLANALQLPVMANALHRTRHTGSQTRLTRQQRLQNVDGAFAAGPTVPPKALLVDDVATTGATLAAAAQALRQAGTQQIGVIALAEAERLDL